MSERRRSGIQEMGGSLTLHTSWYRLLLATLSTWGIAGLLLLAFIHDEGIAGQTILEPIVFVLLELVVVPFALDYTARFLFRMPILDISAEGISVGLTIYGREVIAWHDISRLRVGKQRTLRGPSLTILAIELSNPYAVLASRNWLQRFMLQLTVRSPLFAITLLQWMLPIPGDDLLDEVKQRYYHELHHNDIMLSMSDAVTNRSKR